MHATVEAIRFNMKELAYDFFVSLEPISRSRFRLDDIVDQALMEYIIIDYQMSAPRKSVRQHCIEHGMIDSDDDLRASMWMSRLITKANRYRGIHFENVLQSSGIQILDPVKNEFDGPSNYQNAHQLTNVDFRELVMQGECKLLKKIFEHKLSNKDGVRNPQFKELFSEYEAKVAQMAQSVGDGNPTVVIERTIELFNLQHIYNIEFFYALTLEAEQHGFPRKMPFDRIACLCAEVPVMPPSYWCPIVARAAVQRMLMVRDVYCEDIFTLPDDEWNAQRYGIMEACRLKTILVHLENGRVFLPYVHELTADEKLEFLRERYWLWDKCATFDWSNRKRIQYMRDLYEHLTIDLNSSDTETGENR